MWVTVIDLHAGGSRVHAAGCRNVARDLAAYCPDNLDPDNGGLRFDAASRHELAAEIWGDIASDNTTPGSDAWHQAVEECDGETEYAPCVRFAGNPVEVCAYNGRHLYEGVPATCVIDCSLVGPVAACEVCQEFYAGHGAGSSSSARPVDYPAVAAAVLARHPDVGALILGNDEDGE